MDKGEKQQCDDPMNIMSFHENAIDIANGIIVHLKQHYKLDKLQNLVMMLLTCPVVYAVSMKLLVLRECLISWLYTVIFY